MLHASVSLPEALSCLGVTLAGKGRVLAKCGRRQEKRAGSEPELPLLGKKTSTSRSWVGGWIFGPQPRVELRHRVEGRGTCVGREPPSFPRLLLRIAWENGAERQLSGAMALNFWTRSGVWDTPASNRSIANGLQSSPGAHEDLVSSAE